MTDAFTAVMGTARGSGRGDVDRYGPYAADVEELMRVLNAPEMRRRARDPERVRRLKGTSEAFERAMKAARAAGYAAQANAAHLDVMNALNAKGRLQQSAGVVVLSAATLLCQRDWMSREDIELLAAHSRQMLDDHPLLAFAAPETAA